MDEPTRDEIWRPALGFEGLYEASDQGRVRSLDRIVPHGVGNRYGIGPDGRMRHRKGKVLVPVATPTGHLHVTLSKLGKHPPRGVHVLVKEAFDGPTPDGLMVCHDNGNPADNRLVNLYFGTAYQNSMDTHRHGTNHQLNKTSCPLDHDYVGPNILHKTNKTRNGVRPCRECRSCDNARCRRTYLRRTGRDMTDAEFREYADKRYARIMAGYTAPLIPAQRQPAGALQAVG